MPGMRCLYVSRIVGTFLGFAPDTIHRLDDGSIWRQVGTRIEHVYIERPECRVFTDENRCYLEVEGVLGMVEVRRTHASPWPRRS